MSARGKRKTVVGRLAASAVTGLLCLGICSCGSGIKDPAAFYGTGTPTVRATVYTINGASNTVVGYAVSNSTAQVSMTIQLPAGFTANLVATDAGGNIYVGGYTTDVNATEVLVYAASSDGATSPVRTVVLEPGKLTAMTVDASGELFAAQLNVLASVKVYAASSSGTSTAMRVLSPARFLYLNDVALDSAGDVYVSGYNGGAYFIEEYAAGAMGTAVAMSTMYAPAGSYFGGITVDGSGNIWALENLTIVEFPNGSNGTPTPKTSINLPGLTSPYTAEAYSNVLRRDASGNLFAPLTLTNGSAALSTVYGYGPSQSGNATPLVQFAPQGATQSTPLGINIPLAVF